MSQINRGQTEGRTCNTVKLEIYDFFKNGSASDDENKRALPNIRKIKAVGLATQNAHYV